MTMQALISPAPAPRVPPHDYDSEQALIGALLMAPRTIDRVAEFLRAEHFAEPAHAAIYRACIAAESRGQQVIAGVVWSAVKDNPSLGELGGQAYFSSLCAGGASPMQVEGLGRHIVDLFRRREVIAIAEDILTDAYEVRQDRTIDADVENAEARLFRVFADGGTSGGLIDHGRCLDEAMAEIEATYKADGKLRGVSTGLTDLDTKLGGLHKSDLIILAGRPSMGKSALALNIAEAVAKRTDGAAAFFSLEMNASQLIGRSLAGATGISAHRIRNEINRDEMERLADAAIRRRPLSLHIDQTPGISVTAIRNHSRRLARQKGLNVIVIDYLQLIGQHLERGSRPENRTQEISEITRALKCLAKELSVPVILLSQLNRDVERREDKRPQLADLRESGSIEQDADVVMFVYREEYYLTRSEPKPGPKHDAWDADMAACANTAEVIIAKQRHGPIGMVKLHFSAETVAFGNLVREGGSNGNWSD